MAQRPVCPPAGPQSNHLRRKIALPPNSGESREATSTSYPPDAIDRAALSQPFNRPTRGRIDRWDEVAGSLASLNPSSITTLARGVSRGSPGLPAWAGGPSRAGCAARDPLRLGTPNPELRTGDNVLRHRVRRGLRQQAVCRIRRKIPVLVPSFKRVQQCSIHQRCAHSSECAMLASRCRHNWLRSTSSNQQARLPPRHSRHCLGMPGGEPPTGSNPSRAALLGPSEGRLLRQKDAALQVIHSLQRAHVLSRCP